MTAITGDDEHGDIALHGFTEVNDAVKSFVQARRENRVARLRPVLKLGIRLVVAAFTLVLASNIALVVANRAAPADVHSRLRLVKLILQPIIDILFAAGILVLSSTPEADLDVDEVLATMPLGRILTWGVLACWLTIWNVLASREASWARVAALPA